MLRSKHGEIKKKYRVCYLQMQMNEKEIMSHIHVK